MDELKECKVCAKKCLRFVPDKPMMGVKVHTVDCLEYFNCGEIAKEVSGSVVSTSEMNDYLRTIDDGK